MDANTALINAWLAIPGIDKRAPISREFVAGFDAALATQPGDAALLDWAKRYDIQASMPELRAMVGDARTLHLVGP